MAKMFRLRKDQKGFTLVELMIVIGILGVLAAIVLVSVSAFLGEGKAEAEDMNISTLQHAVLGLLGGAQVEVLDGDYTGVLTWEEAMLVTAGGGTHQLTEYLMPDGFPLMQAVDIDQYGTVTVSAS